MPIYLLSVRARARMTSAAALATTLTASPALQAQSAQWGTLRPGGFAAGFRLVETYDVGRSERPITDFAGHRDQGPAGVPMQLGVWYPATRVANARPMRFIELALATQHRERFSRSALADTAAIRPEVAQNIRNTGADTSRIATLADAALAQSTASVRNAAAARGSFPVAVIATGGWLGATTVLAEYLATHGWIVVATAAQTSTSGGLQVSAPAIAVDVGVNAIEFAVAHARTLPGADLARLALIGVNFDSFSALEYQARYMRASAVVTLNGWETIEDRAAVLRASPWYEPTRLRMPLLNVHWDEANAAPINRAFLEGLKYAERRSLVIRGLDHGGLVLNPLALPSSSEQRRAAYQYLVRAVHATLAGAITDTRDDALQRPPADAGFDSAIVKDSWQRTALPPVPTRAEFFDVIGNRGDLATATRLFHEARSRDSTVQLFSEQQMGLAAFRFERGNRPDNALATHRLTIEAYPTSHLAQNGLGNALLMRADTAGALRAFDAALALLDANPRLTASEKENQARVWRAKVARLRQ